MKTKSPFTLNADELAMVEEALYDLSEKLGNYIAFSQYDKDEESTANYEEELDKCDILIRRIERWKRK